MKLSDIIPPAESGHWYHRDGSPAYEVQAAKGGMRATTLRDARKCNLVPSVTTIIRVAAQPGLERWKQTQLVHSALTLPRIDGESEDDFAKRVVVDAQEQAKKAREKGSEIHGSIEHYFKGGSVPSEHKPVIQAIEMEFADLGLKGPWSAEKSFACDLGYGGKLDLHNGDCVVDFKCKGGSWTDKDKIAYDEHAMQLAAYVRGLGGNQDTRRINIFVSTEELGKVQSVQWDDYDRDFQMFYLLLQYWQLMNRIK